jgi:hypothetical protein
MKIEKITKRVHGTNIVSSKKKKKKLLQYVYNLRFSSAKSLNFNCAILMNTILFEHNLAIHL